jgi:ABC-type transport system involved in multi-copper enzyme maturation permease subunit
MLRTLIRKEITETILDLRFVIATLLCVVLIPLGMYVSLKDYEQRLQEYQTSVQQYEQRSKRSMFSGDFGAEGYRPPSPLSVFSGGLKDKLNMKVTTQYDGNYHIENLSRDENLQAVLFGKIDFAFIVSMVLSLLALIFTFRIVTGEKESGTLRLIVAGNVPRWKVIFSKMVGSYFVFLAPVLLSFLVGLLFLGNSEILLLSAGHFGAIFLVLVISLLFLFCVFNLGIFVSALTHSSIVSMIGVLFAWVVLALVIPKMSPMIAQVVHPIRSRQVVDTEKAMVLGEIRREKEKAEAELYKKVLTEAGLGVERAFDDSAETEQAQKQYNKQKGPVIRQYQERMSKEARRIEEDYTNQRQAQVAIAANLSRISPVCCLVYALSEISGTGSSEIENFSKQAQLFQETVKRNFYDNFEFSEYRTENQWSGGYYRKEGFDLDKFPVPHISGYRHVDLAGALSVCWLDIVLLVLFSVLFFAGAFASFLRYDVR